MIRSAVPVLHVTDSRRSADFYARLLGFTLEDNAPVGPDPCYLVLTRDGVELHLSSHAGDGVVGGVAYLRVSDVDALHAEFLGRGVPIHVGPVDQTWGLREMYVRDPDGNSVRFGSPIPSAQP